MNANELSDWLVAFTESNVDYEEKIVLESATMLRQLQAEIEALKAKTLTDEEILAAIKSTADDVSPHKEYENTYSDGWLDACNTVYDEVFAILRKANEK